jgi:uncharacterized membrane protein YczE
VKRESLRSLGPWLQLVAGLFGYGIAVALMIRSGLGLGPWDAFHVGLHQHTGLTVGTVSILVGLLIVVGTVAMGNRPGAGTLANMVLIGVFIDLLMPLVPDATHWSWGVGYYSAAVVMAGLATGMYIGAGLGSGPRDGLMLGISAHTGWTPGRVRTMIEVAVLAAGWLLGGTVGVGTLMFTLGIGPAVQWGLRLFGALPSGPVPARAGRASWRRAA